MLKKNHLFIECVICAISAFIFIFVIFKFSGLFAYGGYQHSDHQYYIIIKNELQSVGYWKTLVDVCKNYMRYRFNILYPIELVTGVKLFGLNWKMHYLAEVFKFSLCATMLFCISRMQGVNLLFSYAFVFINLVGEQFQLFVDICAIGALPMTFFAAAVVLAIYSATTNKQGSKILFVIISIIGMLCGRENYVIAYPAILCIYFVQFMKNRDVGFKESALNNKYVIASFMLCFAWCSWYILFNLEIGIDGGVLGGGINSDFKQIIINSLISIEWLGYVLFMLIFSVLILLIHFWGIYKNIEIKEKTRFIITALWLVYFVAAELITLSKTGIYARYRVPFMFPLAWILCIVFYNYYKDNKEIIYTYSAMMVITVITLIRPAYTFAESEASFAKTVSEIVDFVKEKADINDNIVIAYSGIQDSDDFNTNVSFQMLLEDVGYPNGYIFREGICEDMYDGKISIDDKHNDVYSNQNIIWTYNFFNYFVNDVKYLNIDDANIILIEEDDIEMFKEYLDDKNMLDGYKNKVFANEKMVVFYK